MFRRILPIAMALGISVHTIELLAFVAAPQVVAESSVVLKLRRLGDRVDVVVDGVSTDARVVKQSSSSTQWRGQLQAAAPLPLGRSQEVALAKAGLQSIRLSPNNQGELELVVKASQGMVLPDPQIRVDGNSLIVSFTRLQRQTMALASGRLDLSRPGRVPQPRFVPPLQSRATAPPLGDMAVGTMLVNPNNVINISGPPVSLVLNNAPAKDALMSLARIGGFGFVYVNSKGDADVKDQQNQLVSLSFKEESFGRAINSILLSSGLQARLDGRTLLVGEVLHNSSFAPQMSKVFRLNQVSTETAANYLSSLGAKMSKVIQIEVTKGEAASLGTSELSSQVSQTRSIESEIETLEAKDGPLLGLVGTSDGRLGTETVVGEPHLISLAENYLKQIDLRKRQVALKVQLISVKLDNDMSIDSSFSSRIGDTFIVSDSGKGHLNFGEYKPGNAQGGGIYGQGVSGVPGTYPRYGEVPRQRVIDPVVQRQQLSNYEVAQERVYNPVTGEETFQDLLIGGEQVFLGPDETSPLIDRKGRPVYVQSSDPAAEQVLRPIYDKNGRLKYVPDSNQYRQANNSFYSYLEAQIQSESAKVLAQPTLLVGEGQTSAVKTGLEVVVNVEVEDGKVTYEKETAGLTLTVGVDKIDDNGFVTMSIVPKLGFPVPAGTQDGIPFFNIDSRELVANGIRLRDRQTLIVSGVISERQTEKVKKWPLLGDLPLIGSLFRASQSERSKEELVVVVTPQVIDDEEGGTFGYGYQPGTSEVKQVLNSYP